MPAVHIIQLWRICYLETVSYVGDRMKVSTRTNGWILIRNSKNEDKRTLEIIDIFWVGINQHLRVLFKHYNAEWINTESVMYLKRCYIWYNKILASEVAFFFFFYYYQLVWRLRSSVCALWQITWLVTAFPKRDQSCQRISKNILPIGMRSRTKFIAINSIRFG